MFRGIFANKVGLKLNEINRFNVNTKFSQWIIGGRRQLPRGSPKDAEERFLVTAAGNWYEWTDWRYIERSI